MKIIEIILLSNNVVLPFQDLSKEFNLEFIELNKLIVSKSLAEHGLGFLIKIYEINGIDELGKFDLLKKIIFDTGGTNLTYLHNLDLRGETLYDTNNIILSHWHYDHFGSLYEILKRIENRVPIICHKYAKNERFFRRAKDVRNDDLKGKLRKEILHLISSSKIVNQEPIDLDRIEDLNGNVLFSNDSNVIYSNNGLSIISSGEIPRKYDDENFYDFFSLQDGVIKEDFILDDKCLIFEFSDRVILLNGCCHSGLKNTLDYVKSITNKPITHIIGGFHMAHSSEQKIRSTLEYLENFQESEEPLYLFPIHCSGEKIIKKINNLNKEKIKAFNVSVGTVFKFNIG